MPELTLYTGVNSCALVPQALLHHLSIPFTAVTLKRGADGLEAADGSFTNAEYRSSIHPSGYVPALKTANGEVITEMPAILTYIALQAPEEQNLLGASVMERVRVAEWLAWLSGTLHGNAFVMLFKPGRLTGDEAAFVAIKEKGMGVAKACFQRIEKRLEGRENAVGKGWTVVDFNLYIFARWGKQIGLDMEGEFPVYSAFARKLEELDGVKKAVKEHGVEALYS
ncbi:hypothetical protein E8E13_008609 [Curvularia kusanoi]|uniref:Glutathione S-transferase n=1 Tax=Curvularia kusanoi TaxID=90978 RepID=A0A9P4W9T2_CURKU|nr:hypothetical protein E8E13_008609 [Curvularia kusanoi]